eukprot:CAMPEP_0170639108 /NCGR_PEP_ID=MMETSP0224-20130122/39450_1 /TAXON_ID=285029 /ORGANISM="Togula jolla, Strain CCCM 725" /LENGTH=541 /DNA_ID=CAMNT_0010969395 /DNA_START=30 /DNA_END=1653 /DNA_ORIENTATION=-
MFGRMARAAQAPGQATLPTIGEEAHGEAWRPNFQCWSDGAWRGARSGYTWHSPGWSIDHSKEEEEEALSWWSVNSQQKSASDAAGEQGRSSWSRSFNSAAWEPSQSSGYKSSTNEGYAGEPYWSYTWTSWSGSDDPYRTEMPQEAARASRALRGASSRGETACDVHVSADGPASDTAIAPATALATGDCGETSRQWLREVNALASELGTATFGDSGPPNPSKAARVLLFVDEGRRLWPSLGRSSVVHGNGFTEVDPDCPFWRAGRSRFLESLRGHFMKINSRSTEEAARRGYLADLGFKLIEDFISPSEEAALLEHWRPNGPEFRKGSNETHTCRRFFHYGPILPKQSFGTTRSTLNVIPGRMGAMPPIVSDLGLRERIRAAAAGLGDGGLELDQLYVNFYSAAARGRIGFHHDHVSTMRGVVAGISLQSDCEFQLSALDRELSGQPTLHLRLPARSLYIMSGLSRYHLQHGIPRHDTDRLSMTFRSVDTASAGSRKLWARDWSSIPAAEAAKCHWPLLAPEQQEPSLIQATDFADFAADY